MKKIGIGYEKYTEFIDQNMYYVDKTLLIRDLLERGGKVSLFTRPRRFGKTLALSMLRTFFEAEIDRDGNPVDNRRYFEGKKIMSCGDEIRSKMGQYPVIKLSLKSAKQPDFYTAFTKIRDEIINEFSRHDYLIHSKKLSDADKKRFKELSRGDLDWKIKEATLSGKEWEVAFQKEIGAYATAFSALSEYLKKHHGNNVIILLDEYDVPLENAYFSSFYDQMVAFIRSLFESCLKTNDNLEFAVVTGCLRISKESIFTGLNHLKINSVRNDDFAEYFGFTQEETETMLNAYGLTEKVEEVKKWYDGYLFGETEVYNPWSVIQYVDQHKSNHNRFPEPYWANTSSNTIIKDLVDNADDSMKEQLDLMISGGTIEKRIHEDITYDDVHESEDNLWNFLFFTGYMKKVSERFDGEDIFLTMKIPNVEIRCIYRDYIRTWFERKVKAADHTPLQQAILRKDAAEAGKLLTELLKKSISTFDSAESFYHGFLLSMLIGTPDYTAKSNRESGDGRPDIILYPENPTDPAILFEIKIRKKFNEMEDGIVEAFTQIKEKRYEEGILDDGYAGVISFGVCFCRKSCILEQMEPM